MAATRIYLASRTAHGRYPEDAWMTARPSRQQPPAKPAKNSASLSTPSGFLPGMPRPSSSATPAAASWSGGRTPARPRGELGVDGTDVRQDGSPHG